MFCFSWLPVASSVVPVSSINFAFCSSSCLLISSFFISIKLFKYWLEDLLAPSTAGATPLKTPVSSNIWTAKKPAAVANAPQPNKVCFLITSINAAL